MAPISRAVSKLCGVARQSVYTWIQEWRVERLIDALKLARASGIPIERLAGDAFKPESINCKIAGVLQRARRRPSIGQPGIRAATCLMPCLGLACGSPWS